MSRAKAKKETSPEMFDYVQGFTQGYFEYVLANDHVTDNEYIAIKYIELVDRFADSNVEDSLLLSFFNFALQDGTLSGRNLDKLAIALKELGTVANDEQISTTIDWTMHYLDVIYKENEKKKR